MNWNLRIIVLAALMVAAPLSYAADTGDWIVTSSGCRVFASGASVKNLAASWTGACSDGYADGKGVLTWSNGNRYEGDLYVGMMSGKGAFYWANGDWYVGGFKDGRREGVGTQYLGCLGKYHGEFHHGVMDGLGVFDLASGDRYQGMFRNGVMEGLGVRNFADGSEYEGQFRSGQQEGLGTLVLANTSHYEGEFMNNLPEGHALVTYPDGDVFEGMYVGGHADGRGILTKPNGERDVGTFKDNNKGVLKLISNIGPQLYEPCQTHCSTTTTSCGGGAVAGINPDDPNYQMKVIDASVTCGREMQQCVTMCQLHNPTAHELKGIVEVGEIDDKSPASATSQTPEAKAAAKKAAVTFVDEQIEDTNDLRKRLIRLNQEVQLLRQKLADIPVEGAVVATLPKKSESECRSLDRRKQ